MYAIYIFIVFEKDNFQNFQVKYFFFQKRRISSMTTHAHGNQSMIDDANVRLTFVPLVFILFRIWGTIRFLINTIVTNPSASFVAGTSWLAILQVYSTLIDIGHDNIVFFKLSKAINELKRSLKKLMRI